ncbi:MAG: hypothetical protein ABIZ56_07700, partial [Chthoniobacteraceae bacterium]
MAFWSPILSLIHYAAENSLHSHILLVPFISGYLIYLQRGALPKNYPCSPLFGTLTFAIGIAAFGVASRMQ